MNIYSEKLIDAMVDAVKANGWVATTSFTENDLRYSFNVVSGSMVEVMIDLLKDTLTSGVIVPTDGGTSFKSSMISYLNTITN
jgi:hypothetical protein